MKFIEKYYRHKLRESFKREFQRVYLLDASCLVDGRIVNVFKHTGFDGKISIPAFVQSILVAMAGDKQFIINSKGKRGLVVIDHLKKNLFEIGRELLFYPTEIDPSEKDLKNYPIIVDRFKEVCKRMVGVPVVITSDSELTRLLKVHNLAVINLNELANDLQDLIFIGEKYAVKLTGIGRETGQATGYIKDKILCVVSKSDKLIGKVVPVVVKNILQTESGRLVFADLQWE